jgi:hypothetical protein
VTSTGGAASLFDQPIERSRNSVYTWQNPCGSVAVSWIFGEDFSQDDFLVLHSPELKADLHR